MRILLILALVMNVACAHKAKQDAVAAFYAAGPSVEDLEFKRDSIMLVNDHTQEINQLKLRNLELSQSLMRLSVAIGNLEDQVTAMREAIVEQHEQLNGKVGENQ